MNLEEIKKTHESWMEEAVYQRNCTEKAEAEVKRLKDCLQHVTGNYAPYERERARADKAEAELSACKEWTRKLEKCLEPFALAANETDGNKQIDSDTIIWKPQSNFRKTYGITVGDLRAAREALEAQEQTKEVEG
jgi:hypothetical protein